MSTFEDLLTDIHNAVRVVLTRLAPRLAPHLPTRAPQAPHNYDIVTHPRPVWRGTTRIVIEDELISIERRDGDGWTPLWRSDSPNIPPRRDEIEARAS